MLVIFNDVEIAMFKLNSKQSYMMPAHFGAKPLSAKMSGWYHDVTMMVVSYITDRDKLAAYLPDPYEVGEHAVVTVVYACNKQVDWLAGHGYNLVGVHASAVFKGERDNLAGQYALVMWENLTDPILTGRELQGIPKIYADIPEHQVIANEWRAAASHFGHKIVDLSINNLRTPTAEEISAAQAAQEGKNNPMGWRFFPGLNGIGECINEGTLFPSETIYHDVKVGEGLVDWKNLTWEQNPTQFHIVNALAELPVVSYLPAMVAKCSVNLLVPNQLPRVID